ncbi:MAG: extracellular solute-binding protein, partial [Ruminococcaceae bacterium]|nr:extracellular solute-binding protein [Oscillospiraceae bacterium]
MKKALAVILVALLALSAAACGGKKDNNQTSGETVTLKVWGAQEDQELLATMVESFKAANPDTTYTIELGVVSEADAKSCYLEDPAAAADVFAFSNDQLKDLVSAGALYEISGSYKDTATGANSEGSIGAATLDGKLYGFPMTADNGYFLYYDSSVFTEE